MTRHRIDRCRNLHPQIPNYGGRRCPSCSGARAEGAFSTIACDPVRQKREKHCTRSCSGVSILAVSNLVTPPPMRRRTSLDGPQAHSVPCLGCHNNVSVLVSDSYPPCFHHLEQQAHCPEVQRRRRSNDDSTLLTMCGALNRSLVTQLELAEVEAIVHEGRWVIVSRAANNRDMFYSANQARRQAALWKGCYESIHARKC